MVRYVKRRSVLRNYIATYFLVFAIPLVIFSYIIYMQTVSKFTEEYLATLDVAANGVCTNLTRIYDLSASNANFTRENQYYSDSYIKEIAGSFVYIGKNMRNLSGINKDFTQLAFYSVQSDMIYSNSIYNKNFYFSNIFKSSLLNNEVELTNITTSTWLPMHRVIFEDAETLMSTIIHPIQRTRRNNKSYTQSLLFSHLSEAEMLQILSPITAVTGAHAIVLWNNAPLFSDNYELMQEFITQNKASLHGDVINLNNEAYQIRVTNEQNNIALISLFPQNSTHGLAKDIMLIYAFSLTLSVVVGAVLIFFSIRYNYRPIVKLLRKVLSASDLPSEVNNLNEMEQTSYGLDNIIENKRQYENDNRQFKLNHLLLRLCENSSIYINQPSYQRRRTELGLDLNAKYYCCIIFKQCENREALISAILADNTENGVTIYPAADLEENTIIALICSENADESIVERILKSKEGLYGVAGIGAFVNAQEQVTISFKQAYHSLLHIVQGQKNYRSNTTMQVDKSDILTQFAKEADLFSNAIIQRRQNQMRLSLSRVSDLLEIVPNDSSFPVMLHHIQFVAVKALAAANLPFNTAIDVFSKLPTGEYKAETQQWIDSLSAHIATLIYPQSAADNLANTAKETKQDVAKDMQYILLYINSGYAKLDFSIKSLADELGISVSNLSHFFKSRQGQNLSDYICELRITEAKRLLRETSLSITDIVPRLGYTHISSFTKTFKKVTGLTPSEYKSLNSKET